MRQTSSDEDARVLRRIRLVLLMFIAGLVVSGLTAFPLLMEMEWLAALRSAGAEAGGAGSDGFHAWVLKVRDGLRETYGRYPWVAYGTDWLAFAHLAIAVFFVGPLVDPRRNVWVLWAGVVACVGIVPLALVAGGVRGIPWGWRVIDCSFGILGALPLAYCLMQIRRWETRLSRAGTGSTQRSDGTG